MKAKKKQFGTLFGLVLALGVMGCGVDKDTLEPDGGETESIVAKVTYDALAEKVVIDFKTDANAYIVSCTDALKVFKIVDGQRVPFVNSSWGDGIGQGGYYIDGEFLPCYWNEGCDVLSCDPLTSTSIIMHERVSVDDQPLAAEDATKWLETCPQPPWLEDTDTETVEAPATVPAYEWQAYHGPIEIDVMYYLDGHCNYEFVGEGEAAPAEALTETIEFVVP